MTRRAWWQKLVDDYAQHLQKWLEGDNAVTRYNVAKDTRVVLTCFPSLASFFAPRPPRSTREEKKHLDVPAWLGNETISTVHSTIAEWESRYELLFRAPIPIEIKAKVSMHLPHCVGRLRVPYAVGQGACLLALVSAV